jgi:hypothetical protein
MTATAITSLGEVTEVPEKAEQRHLGQVEERGESTEQVYLKGVVEI